MQTSLHILILNQLNYKLFFKKYICETFCLEVSLEHWRLVPLDLPVLHGGAPQGVVQLDGVDGRRARLVLGMNRVLNFKFIFLF